MNDFTKEELKELMYGLYCKAKLEGNITNKILYDKIKLMIDNYCEHEWENICCACTLDKIFCHKCEKDMSHLKERIYE